MAQAASIPDILNDFYAQNPTNTTTAGVFVSGIRSGVGKSTFSLSLIGNLLKEGLDSSDVSYIKPVTQCEGVQTVSQFCHHKGIRHVDLGPVVFRQGFTYNVIEEDTTESREQRLKEVVEAVRQVSKEKKFVVVDGLGYPSVGSVAGVCNAQVAAALGLPVILVGTSGVGDAIDSLNMARAYFERHSVPVIGAVFGKVRTDCPRHSFSNCVKYVSKYFEATSFPIFGFVPESPLVKVEREEATCVFVPQARALLEKSPPPEGKCCHRDLSVSDDAIKKAEATVSEFGTHVDFVALVKAVTQVLGK